MRLSRRAAEGFTILEVSFAAVVFSAFATGSILTLAELNRFANEARYETLALSSAQHKMDQVMTATCSLNPLTSGTSVYSPTLVSGTTTLSPNSSTLLTTATSQVTTEQNLPLNNDIYNSEAGLSSAFTGLDSQITLTRVTTITADPTYPRLLGATVSVTYTCFKNQYNVTLKSIRCTDNF